MKKDKKAPSPASPAGGVEITHAVRLRREDLARLGEIHKRQFVAMMAPRRAFDDAAELVEQRGADDGEGSGLVYVRVEGGGRAFDGWICDDARHPSTKVSPGGALFFAAGTTDSVGVEMSQSTWHSADHEEPLRSIREAVAGLRVAVRGAPLTADPPFALATAPPPAAVASEDGALELEVLAARRLTERDARALPAESRFQLLHALRPKFATKDVAGMEDPMQLGMVYGFVDPGPDTDSWGHRGGLVYLRLREKGGKGRVFDGWFYDWHAEDPATYWPSRTASISSGRLFEDGSTRFTGVELAHAWGLDGAGKVTSRPRIGVDPKKGLPVAKALAVGLKRLGLSFDVELVRKPRSGEKGYFGSEAHARQLREARGAQARK